MGSTPADRSVDPAPREGLALARSIEIVFLLLVCGGLFFVGLGRFDLVKTEGLRAIVVAEMLEPLPGAESQRGAERWGISMPSVHHRPQLKKPPAYAWCTTALARAVGHLDEQIARLPSALAATALVLLLYGVAEARLGRGAGLAAAALAIANPTLIDYAMRAELDMGFTFLTTVSILLAYPGVYRSRQPGPPAQAATTGVVCWMGCYLAATAAALWKGPHSLIFLWVLLLAYGWRKRAWRWLGHPGQVCGLILSLGVLIGWTLTLSGHAGGGSVARMAGIELVSRLIPLNLEDLLSILYAVPMMAVVALPASLLVIASFRSGVVYEAADRPSTRSVTALVRFCMARFRRWWAALAADRFVEFLLFWIFANLVWTVIVPAKAPRYWLPLFPPVFLLAAHVLRRRMTGAVPAAGQRHLDVTWRCIYGVIGAGGFLALAVVILFAIVPGARPHALRSAPTWPWLVMGSGWLAVAVMGLWRRVGWATTGRCLGLVVAVLAFRPVLSEIWWPIRAASDSQRASAAQIDRIVPPGEPVFVLGPHEFPDVAFYSRRRFQWIDEPGEARAYAGAPVAHCLLRTEDLDEWVTEKGSQYTPEFVFVRADKPVTLIRVDLAQSRP